MKNVLVRASSMRAVNSNVRRAGSVQHVENPISQDMASRNNTSDGNYSTVRPEITVQNPNSQDMVEIEMTSVTTIGNTNALPKAQPVSKSNRKGKKKTRRKTVLDKIKSKKNKSNEPPLPKTEAQTARRERLRSLHTKRQSLDDMDSTISVFSYDNPSINENIETVEKKEDDELHHNPMNKRKAFRKIVDDEHGVYFQDVDTEETVWELPEDGDVVVNDDELQHNPMKK